MRFSVAASLYYQVTGPATLLGLFRCSRSRAQRVLSESVVTNCGALSTDLTVGIERNRFTRFELFEFGDLAVHYQATALCSARRIALDDIGDASVGTLNEAMIPFLFPSRYVPSDRFRSIATDLFGGISGKLYQALAVEEWLHRNITYWIGSSTEQSSARDTFEMRSGVCRDFAHLGIAFCRALCIPARYVTVYAYQLQPQDFHAVFEVCIGGIWILLDGTRLAPLNGMLRIATGRDAGDSAVATLFGGLMGQGFWVNTTIPDAETEIFVPVYREELMAAGESLVFG